MEHLDLRHREAFRHAESLHVNFYEDHLPEDYVIEQAGSLEGYRATSARYQTNMELRLNWGLMRSIAIPV